MGIIIDLSIMAIILLSTFLAYKKGLVSLAIGLCSFFIAIGVTLVLYKPISNLVINVTGIDEAIENSIYEKACEVMQEQNTNPDISNQIIQTTKNQMLPETVRTLAVNIVTGGVMIVLFTIIKIALKFVSILADLVAKIPVISQLNEAGGMVYGLVRGLLIIYVALLIVHIPTQIIPDNEISKSIEQSSLGKAMYENNILNVFFK